MRLINPIAERLGEAYGIVQGFFKDQVELRKLELTERVAKTISSLIAFFLIFSMFSMVVLFGTFAIGYYLAKVVDSNGLAFAIISLFYALVGTILYFFRRPLILTPVLELVIRILQDEEYDD